MNYEDDVRNFMHAAGQECPPVPTIPDEATRALRYAIVKEECHELRNALAAGDLVQIADACADLVYVAIGTAVACGIPFDEVWNEVHRSNMDKFPGGVVTRREDGKILKPPGWTPPGVALVLAFAMANRGAK